MPADKVRSLRHSVSGARTAIDYLLTDFDSLCQTLSRFGTVNTGNTASDYQPSEVRRSIDGL